MDREWVVDVVERLPQALVSRAWGWLARRKYPRPGVRLLKKAFVASTGIDMTEAEADIESYQTLEDLFVRTLKPGARRIEPDPTAFVSPVDGTVGASGMIFDGQAFQVKGRSYSLARLLGSEDEAKRYEGGDFVTIYLSPRDYHRIHSPVSGVVSEAVLIPGALMPVFPEAVEKVDELFARNERLISYVDTKDIGRVAVVKVGATLVGRITTAYDPELQTNIRGQSRICKTYDPPHLVPKGGELGAFELGSTVVILTEKGRVKFDVVEDRGIRMGLRLGTLVSRKAKRSSKKKT